MPESYFFTDNQEETLLSTFVNANIAEFICHEGFREYYNLYKKTWVPESYIEFTFEEYKKYASISGQDLKHFFSLYKKEDVRALIEYYLNSAFAIVDKKRERGDENYYLVSNAKYADVMLSNEGVYGKNDIGLYSMLEKVATHMVNNDENTSRKELYERYMLKNYLKNNLKTFAAERHTNRATSTSQTQNKHSDQVLVGNSIDVPKLGGKISKLFFPKLSLPGAFPVSFEKSRINSNYRAHKFMASDREVTLVTQHKFNNVKYKKSFIEKRKAAMKPQRKNFKFDF